MLYDWYFIKNVYNPAECRDIVNHCQNNISNKIKDIHPESKKLKAAPIETITFDGKLDRFFNLVYNINQRMFGLRVWNQVPLSINFNTYEAGHEYQYHRDKTEAGEMSDVKLTAILNLSLTSFTGGDFSFFVGQEKIIPEINEIGSLLIFPSYLYHKVSPVTHGQRMTLSAWLEGPNWK